MGAREGPAAFVGGKDLFKEAISKPRQRFLDAANVDNVVADAKDLDAPALVRPAAIAARIFKTAGCNPAKTASPIKKCPILSSTICGNAAIALAVV